MYKTAVMYSYIRYQKRANEVMRWRHNQRMKEKQSEDLEVILAKEAEHRAQYRAQLAHKRALGRLRLRPEGPRQKQIQQDTHPTLSVVIKGDVDGSVEAILDILETYDEHSRVRLDLVHYGVGHVTPNDVEIAHAFNAVIYAFNVGCAGPVAAEARRVSVSLREHNVIYRLVDDIKQEISSRIPKRQEEEVVGEASVLQQFLVSEGRKRVPVAGCRCVRGALARHAHYRLTRNGHVIHEGKLASMKHLKDEVTTIKRDMECGLRFEAAVEVQPGDTITCYNILDVDDHTQWDPGF